MTIEHKSNVRIRYEELTGRDEQRIYHRLYNVLIEEACEPCTEYRMSVRLIGLQTPNLLSPAHNLAKNNAGSIKAHLPT